MRYGGLEVVLEIVSFFRSLFDRGDRGRLR